MQPRFFTPDLDPANEILTLPADEGRHLARVLRCRPGDEIRVFDGRGHEYRARVVNAGPTLSTVRLLEPIVPAPESPVTLTVAQAVLAGDKMDSVVRDLTMLGAAAVQPLVSARSETSVAVLTRARRAGRWRRIAVASAKQCGRAVIPAVGEPVGLQDWLRTDTSGVRLILTEPEGDGPAGRQGPPNAVRRQTRGAVTLLVGPEGGWAAEETAMAMGAGFVPWTLGRRTLRADAAALVAVAILQHLWGDL